jgi:hypothetical protein
MAVAATDPLSPRSGNLGTIAAAYLKIAAGDDVDDAVRAMQAVAAALADEPGWWARAEAADADVTAALGWERLDRARDADRCWTAALTHLELIKQPIYDRRLARVRARLAQRWVGSKPDAARRLAGEAIAWYRAAGGYETVLAALAPIAGAQP